jgi:hypothetical protein
MSTLCQPVLWIDPGGMTGLALYTPFTGMVQIGEFAFMDAASRIESACRSYRPSLLVGWERFTITGQTHKKSAEGPADAIEMIGVAKYLARLHGCQILRPAQQHTPDANDRKRLEALGWWRPGEDDAQSAAAHLLNWMLRENAMPPSVAAKLPPVYTGR